MAFLYGNTRLGTPGQKGNVEVVDVPAATVVCIGVRGQRSDDVLTHAEQRLRNWLEQNKGQYEQSGPVRVMGYNSPFVARDRQFFEVQIPVREVASVAAK
jgi:DNA gyrase inhibitor GyrI